MRRENKQRRVREKASSRGLTANYLEPDAYEEDDEGAISLAAIKNKFKNKQNGEAVLIFTLGFGCTSFYVLLHSLISLMSFSFSAALAPSACIVVYRMYNSCQCLCWIYLMVALMYDLWY